MRVLAPVTSSRLLDMVVTGWRMLVSVEEVETAIGRQGISFGGVGQ